MREPTLAESQVIDRRRKEFEGFVDERLPVLTDFMMRLALPNPHLVVTDAEMFLPALDSWLREQVIEEADRTWILTRIGYFVGEYFAQKYGGYWLLNDVAGSKSFGRYVIGGFTRTGNQRTMVDPFSVAHDCVLQPPGRSLACLIAEVEKAITAAVRRAEHQ